MAKVKDLMSMLNSYSRVEFFIMNGNEQRMSTQLAYCGGNENGDGIKFNSGTRWLMPLMECWIEDTYVTEDTIEVSIDEEEFKRMLSESAEFMDYCSKALTDFQKEAYRHSEEQKGETR